MNFIILYNLRFKMATTKCSMILIQLFKDKKLIWLNHFGIGVGVLAHFRLQVVVTELQTEMEQVLQPEILGKFHRKLCAKNMYRNILEILYYEGINLCILLFSSANRIGDYNGSGGAANAPQQLLLSANSSLLREFYQNGHNQLQLNAASSHSGMNIIKIDFWTF